MHILIISSEPYIPKDTPLLGIFQHHQAQALKRAGYKIGVISCPELSSLWVLSKGITRWPKGMRVEHDGDIPVFKYNGLRWIPYIPENRIWLFLRAGKKLFKKYIAQYGMPDVVHAHNARFAGLLACQIKRRWSRPYVLTEHSSSYAREPVAISEIGWIRNVFKDASERLVVSPGLGRFLEGVIGDSIKPWKWLPNVLDHRFEGCILSSKKAAGQLCFLNVGSLIEIKGQADLLRAFADKFRGKNNVQLVIVGEGPLKEKLKKLADEMSIGSQVSFKGGLSREEVLAEMRACDIYVHSSHYETFGVALIEALSCGKPVISTACGGPDCIVGKGDGVLVPVGDIASLGEAMVSMQRDMDRYSPYQIRESCIARFGEHTIINRLMSIYSGISAGQGGE